MTSKSEEAVRRVWTQMHMATSLTDADIIDSADDPSLSTDAEFE